MSNDANDRRKPRAPGRFFTNIKALDRLLGGKGIPHKSVVLVSGDPGTGKTTLAWEMIRNCEPMTRAVFLSCDELATKAWEDYCKSYDPQPLVARYGDVRPPAQSPSRLFLKDVQIGYQRLEEKTGRRARTEATEAEHPDATDIEGAVTETVANIIGDLAPGVIIVDGLNSFIDVAGGWVRGGKPFDEHDVRRLLRTIKVYFQRLMDPAIAILTCERRDDRSDRLYESYLADVSIDLRRERLNPDPSRPELVESILTCGVLKGRGMHVQRRRVCYDFEPKRSLSVRKRHGIRFYETYPAEGTLSLFHENAPQRRFNEEFKTVDRPTLYPRLSLREFDLKNMYHEYAIRRRGRDFPSRRPLHVMNIDEYWVRALHDNGILARLRRNKFHVYGQPKSKPAAGQPTRGPGGEFVDEIEPWDIERVRSQVPADRPPRSGTPRAAEWIYAVPHFANVSMFVYRKSIVAPHLKPPFDKYTLKDIEEACVGIKKDGVVRFPLKIEIKHQDTFACTLLELIIAHGGMPTVKAARGKLEFTGDSKALDQAGVEALEMLRRWVHSARIVQPFGTIDPFHPRNRSRGAPTWAIGRHWYSSLINVLFLEPPPGKPSWVRRADAPHVRDIAVTPVPPAKERAHPCCIWGEWYLAVERGAENLELAYALIDNFLAPSKMISHTMTGAGLPVSDQFFDEFGHVRCIGTDLTYSDLRQKFYKLGEHAFRRSDIAEYRSVMQKLYAAGLQMVQNEGADAVKVWESFRRNVQSTTVPKMPPR